MELETWLWSAEDEVTKSQQDWYQLSLDIDRIGLSQEDLLLKIKESEDVLSTCIAFLEKNGLVATSFMSDEMF